MNVPGIMHWLDNCVVCGAPSSWIIGTVKHGSDTELVSGCQKCSPNDYTAHNLLSIFRFDPVFLATLRATAQLHPPAVAEMIANYWSDKKRCG